MNNWDYWNRWNYVGRYNEGNDSGMDMPQQSDNSNPLPENLRHVVGPTLIALGQPINALKPVGALGSKPGTSIASVIFRNIPGKLPFGMKLFGTRGLGAAIGRFVPYLGWGITALDIFTIPPTFAPNPNNGWEPLLPQVDNTRVVLPQPLPIPIY